MLNYLYYFIGGLFFTLVLKVGLEFESWVVSIVIGNIVGVVVFWLAKHFPNLFDSFDLLD